MNTANEQCSEGNDDREAHPFAQLAQSKHNGCSGRTLRRQDGGSVSPLKNPSRFFSWQLRHSGASLAICAALALLGGWTAKHLVLRSELWQLLPEDQNRVVELARVTARTTGVSNVFVVLEGGDIGKLRATGTRMVVRLRALGPEWVGSADAGVQETRDFLLPRAGLFADRKALEDLKKELDERRRRHLVSVIVADLEPLPPLGPDRLTRLLGRHAGMVTAYPQGYFASRDGRTLVVAVRVPVMADDIVRAGETLARIRSTVEEVIASTPEITAGFAGDLVTGLTEYSAVRSDLLGVGILGASLILGVVFLYYRRLRSVLQMGITIAIGCAWAFGLT